MRLFAQFFFSWPLAGQFQYTTRLSAEVEGRFTSAERILTYLDEVPQEDQGGDKVPLGPAWPEKGSIDFNGVEVK